MEIIVEIGTQEDQELIRAELDLISLVTSQTNNIINISKVIVPSDFDAKVNELQRTLDYRSHRGVVVLAKNVNLEDGDAIVMSPLLYTSGYFDAQVRLFILLHEMVHTLNKNSFPKSSCISGSEGIYIRNLYTLYDEYVADRLALTILDNALSIKTTNWNKYISDYSLDISLMINDPKYYENIKTEIDIFRHTADVAHFLKNIDENFHNVAICIAHLFAISHHYSYVSPSETLSQSHFVNEKTTAIMNFFNGKHQERAYDVNDGFDLMVEFMTNFGMKFKDLPEGIYCEVLDI